VLLGRKDSGVVNKAGSTIGSARYAGTFFELFHQDMEKKWKTGPAR